MNPKLTKINTEYEKNRGKISELQARQRELDRQRKEIENNEILELVQSHKLDAESLAALLRAMKDNPAPLLGAGAPAKSDDFVGRGGVTERADSVRLRTEELSEVHDDEEDIDNENE